MVFLKKTLFCLSLLSLPVSVWAASQEDAYEQALQYAQSAHVAGTNITLSYGAEDVPGFTTDNPRESELIDADLDLAGRDTLQENEGALAIIASSDQRPEFTIDDNDPAVLQSEEIFEEAQDILGGTTPCQTLPSLCETTYTYRTCEVGNTLDPITCTQTLSVIPGQVQQDTQTLTLAVSATRTVWLNMPAQVISFRVDLASGQLLYTSGGNELLGSRVSVSPLYQTGACDTLSVLASASPTIGFKMTKAPTCNDPIMGFQVTVLSMSVSTSTTVTVKLQIESTFPPQDTWQDNCAPLASQSSCRLTEPAVCIEGPQTRIIDGVSITRDYWAKQLTYSCADTIDTCTSLREQGCEQIGATCQQGTTEGCAITTQTWACAQTQCTPDETTVCSSEIFCLEGDCTDPDTTFDADFEATVSILSALDQGIKTMDPDIRIYSGDAMACSEIPVGFKNCCADRGWGFDLGLASCNAQERQLGQAKEKGLAVYVGRFCAERVLGVCLRYKRGHCVFDNTQAFLMQSQARERQLGLGFGTAEEPSCGGFTPEQLMRIDFEKIDFSPLFAELHSQISLPDASELVGNIEAKRP
ncbi:MAG: conjugal transfer protein TraN [Gammaproteobacteria bacterium]